MKSIYQAILVRYLPPTDTKPSRYKAYCDRGSITVCSECGPEAARHAVDTLLARFIAEDKEAHHTPRAKNPWNRPYVLGACPHRDRSSYVAVLLSR